MIASNNAPAAPDSACERRKAKLRTFFEGLLKEVTAPEFFGRRTLTIVSRNGIPEMVELETKDQIKLA